MQELRDLNQVERERHVEARACLQAAEDRAMHAQAAEAAAASAASRVNAGAAEREALLRDFATQVLLMSHIEPPCQMRWCVASRKQHMNQSWPRQAFQLAGALSL